MESVFIISDYSGWLSNLAKKLNLKENQIISYESDLDEDWKMDIWVDTQIPKTSKAVIIPIELGINNALSIEGLKIAMHLRLLNKENTKRYIPIIFISNRENWQITQLCRDIRDRNHLDYLIGTKGTDLLKPIIEDIIPTIANLKSLTEEEYFYDFYYHIKILQNENIGKHSIANSWGAFKLAQVTGNLNLFDDNLEFKKLQGDLYFKYINANTNTVIKSYQKVLINDNKKILLIDDQAEKGWDVVLSSVFQKATFKVVAKSENETFSSFYTRAKNESLKEKNHLPFWDLILLDLRLDENEDIGENSNKLAGEYSGAKILEDVKANNQGTQVIMFTASNKAWNMRELQIKGSNGFYVKESPEYNSDDAFSIENFKSLTRQIEDCYKLEFLRLIVYKSNQIKKIINNNITLEEDFRDRTLRNLQVSFELFSMYIKDSKLINYGYLQLFQIIEDFIKLENIFEKGPKSFAYCNGKKNLVLEIKQETANLSPREQEFNSYIKRSIYSDYTAEKGTHKGTLDTYFIVSSLLIFRYGHYNSSEWPLQPLEKPPKKTWKDINNKRNDIGHGNKDNNVIKIEMIDSLLDFLIYILNDKNQREYNPLARLQNLNTKI
jgi:CheY-like chemotaxis protein